MVSSFLSGLSILFFCLSKCVIYGAETTAHFLTSKEAWQLSLKGIEPNFFSQEEPSLFEIYGYDSQGNDYKKIVFHKRYSLGRDALNRGGGALSYYFNPHISVKTGPSWCRDIGIEKKWKWACQLNFELPFSS